MSGNRYYCFAEFRRVGAHLFRIDTRIYLSGTPDPDRTRQEPLAVVIGKNPGSAKPVWEGEWGLVDPGRDGFLPYVRNRFQAAFHKIGRAPSAHDYVSVYNLFYLCDEVLKTAIAAAKTIEPKVHEGVRKEQELPLCSLVWYAWGGEGDPYLDSLKARFLAQSPCHGFFISRDGNNVEPRRPTATCFARHPRGVTAAPAIEELLARRLRSADDDDRSDS